MKWNKIVEDAVKDGYSKELLTDTIAEMQEMIDYVKDIEPELYWNLKHSVLTSVYGSANYGYDTE